MQQIYRRPPMPKCDINKVALQFYWNHTSTRVFSCKFSAYFQNTFSNSTYGGWLLNAKGNFFLFSILSKINKSLRWSRTFYWAHQFRPLSNLVKTCVKMEIWMASELNFYRLIYFRLDWLFCQIQNHKVFFYSAWFIDAMIRLMILIWVIDENIH